jgi:hypothetical protein
MLMMIVVLLMVVLTQMYYGVTLTRLWKREEIINPAMRALEPMPAWQLHEALPTMSIVATALWGGSYFGYYEPSSTAKVRGFRV